MTGTKQTRRDFSFSTLIVATALLAAASVAQAQTCAGKLPTPTDKSATGGDKFKLIVDQCPGLAEPVTVRRASQLDLYERGSITIKMSEPVEEAPAPRPAPVFTPPSANVPSRDVARVMDLAPAITAAAQTYNIDPLLLHAIAHIESRHRTGAVSPAGARGAMQMMPATARRFGVDDEKSLLDGETNVRASAAYIRTLRIRYGDDVRLVLAAYNAGEGAVDKAGGNIPPYPETQAYVRDVLAVYRRLTATFAVTSTGTLVSRNEQRGDK
jgi:soluble lytic murein transglycosylase-like protein